VSALVEGSNVDSNVLKESAQKPSKEGGEVAGLDDLLAQIPVQDIANKLGAPEAEVNSAIQTLVPALVGSVQHSVQADDIDSSKLEAAVNTQAASGLLDGGVSVDQVDQHEGENLVASLFGGNSSNSVASALAGTGAGSSDLVKKLLPILLPIVLAYVGKKFAGQNAPAGAQAAPAGGGGIGDILGSILGGGSGGGGNNNPLGSILGSVLGGGGSSSGQGNAIGEILGGLLGGKK
jgi:hypothetical protein